MVGQGCVEDEPIFGCACAWSIYTRRPFNEVLIHVGEFGVLIQVLRKKENDSQFVSLSIASIVIFE